MKLTPAQHDRSAGVLLGLACGDALGAGYEFAGPLPDSTPVSMRGGGGFHWAPGEWTDYTAMAVPLALAAADGGDLRDEAVLDGVAVQWVGWAKSAPYGGIQLGAVLSRSEPTAAGVRRMAREQHERNGRSAGAGSLPRTAAVALAYLDDPGALADAARLVSELTHCETDTGDACVLWGLAIRHAVMEGELDLRVGLPLLPAGRRAAWAARFAYAEEKRPADFSNNGWVVQTLQGAWSAITHTQGTDAGQVRRAIEAAARGGGETDAVAATVGALVAARWGLAEVPTSWRRLVQGWPGLRGVDLVRLSMQAAHRGEAADADEVGERRGVKLRALR
ncbi:ADP-ribosylglycohydrolase family protein [Cryobacterium sp. TMT1-21]|uniref:ADP-ribosylglycohydrolase family protein n=1 Tax=Cryobacterium shii TaxID=1259235 RepID=A0AAQ2C8Y1_9MICO|nr:MULTISPECIES: ADP-ribosylglycohydrolase family protein [Cryobacterium]TFC52876.1 ADP-ribosylglycohydrolase family protein [Cryobacterium shii]TFD18035.1 ADP-ribosylglycohydrolase family protein [Cryobacterium sp. TMT1-21]TFD25073.1 ADP-ribosylglycohydrolase family protein [Cryobacterium sp. TMT2-23]TFD40848.1 ADP-ribosylglycohydrolase family protein [Cryobacterium sp. TMT2-10]